MSVYVHDKSDNYCSPYAETYIFKAHNGFKMWLLNGFKNVSFYKATLHSKNPLDIPEGTQGGLAFRVSLKTDVMTELLMLSSRTTLLPIKRTKARPILCVT